MISTDQAKALAKELSHRGDLTHSQVLEAVAHASGHRDWNTFVAVGRDTTGPDTVDAIARQQVVPILRVFDVDLARRFYVDVLGFTWRWQHQAEPDLPVYAEVERDGRVLHLSEHHGDATPGSAVMLVVADVEAEQARILARPGLKGRPGIEDDDWGRTMTVHDPFGNRLVLWQRA